MHGEHRGPKLSRQAGTCTFPPSEMMPLSMAGTIGHCPPVHRAAAATERGPPEPATRFLKPLWPSQRRSVAAWLGTASLQQRNRPGQRVQTLPGAFDLRREGREGQTFLTFLAAKRPTAGSSPTMGAAYLTKAGVTSWPFLAMKASGRHRVFLATWRSSTRSNLTL